MLVSNGTRVALRANLPSPVSSASGNEMTESDPSTVSDMESAQQQQRGTDHRLNTEPEPEPEVLKNFRLNLRTLTFYTVRVQYVSLKTLKQ